MRIDLCVSDGLWKTRSSFCLHVPIRILLNGCR